MTNKEMAESVRRAGEHLISDANRCKSYSAEGVLRIDGKACCVAAEFLEATGTLSPAEVAELVRAKDEGRVVVLPYKPGITVYSVEDDEIFEHFVDGFGYDEEYYLCVYVNQSGMDCNPYDFYATRDEAMKALEGGIP